ncbi:MAG TPA: hypothetical protein VFE98_03005 [Candidatus Bathyarchaeia archaeon]|nr:hypothetical protein [Candidatus Bathyarchaeia archaeon]
MQIPEEAGQGTMFQPQAVPKPLNDQPKDPAAETLKIRTPTGREYVVERKRK